MKILHNVISKSLIDLCNSEIDDIKEWKKSQSNWEKGLNQGFTGNCLYQTASKRTTIKILASVRKHLPKVQMDKYFVQFHVWQTGSGIQWHSDDIYKFGATIYLNEWNRRWGGLFLYETDKIYAEVPEPAKLVIVENDPHSVTPILSHAPYERRSIQIWGLMV